MTTINDEIRIREGDQGQTYGKLYVNNNKELHFSDGYGQDTNLLGTNSMGVSEETFSDNKNAQEQINQTILQALDGYVPLVYSVSFGIGGDRRTSSGFFSSSFTIPPNTLKTGSVIELVAFGNIASWTSGTVQINSGSLAGGDLATTPVLTPISAQNWTWYLEGTAVVGGDPGSSVRITAGGLGAFGRNDDVFDDQVHKNVIIGDNATNAGISIGVATQLGGTASVDLLGLVIKIKK